MLIYLYVVHVDFSYEIYTIAAVMCACAVRMFISYLHY